MKEFFDAFNDFSLALCGDDASRFLDFEMLTASDHYAIKEAFLRRAERQKKTAE